jgi:hypothetical protein
MGFDWYHRRPYTVLLLALVILFLGHPLFRAIVAGRWLYDLLILLVFLAVFLLLFRSRRHRAVAVLLGVPTVVAQWTGYVVPGLPSEPLAIWFHVFASLFLGFMVIEILKTIHEKPAISSDSLAGAFGGYLLAGAVFSHVYCVLEILAPGSFRVSADFAAGITEPVMRHLLLNYFSFMTLTTVGYGDITPVTQPARSLAALEAVVGQFYIAVIMAELIGLKLAQSGR